MILEGGRGLRELLAFMLILVGGWKKYYFFIFGFGSKTENHIYKHKH
jgi:hypothetical protein